MVNKNAARKREKEREREKEKRERESRRVGERDGGIVHVAIESNWDQ